MTMPEYEVCDCGKRGTHAVCNEKPSGPLDGKWKVTCHGWATMFNPLGDHKVISGAEGHNEAVGIKGAYFHIEPIAGGFRLIYDHKDNHKFFHDIIDHIFPQDDGSYHGILYKGGDRKFSFTLERA